MSNSPSSSIRVASAADGTTNQVLELPTKLFTPIPGNRPVTVQDVTNLLASIRRDGQLNAGICYPNRERDGHWVIAAGNRRHFCCDVLGMPFKFIAVEGNRRRHAW